MTCKPRRLVLNAFSKGMNGRGGQTPAVWCWCFITLLLPFHFITQSFSFHYHFITLSFFFHYLSFHYPFITLSLTTFITLSFSKLRPQGLNNIHLASKGLTFLKNNSLFGQIYPLSSTRRLFSYRKKN